MFRSNATYSLQELAVYFLRLGTIGFGGPVALVGYMHRDLVEQRKWIDDDDYNEGMALAQLSPGPLASQLAIYLGYVHYRILGATLAGICFVIPSFVIVVLLGWVYVQYGGIPWIQAVFYGVGAGVIGIIAVSSYKLTRKAIGIDYFRWGVFLIPAVTTFWFEEENPLIILGSAGIYCLWKLKRPLLYSLSPILLFASVQNPSGNLLNMGWFFTKAGAFVFGSGLAIVPFLYGGVVHEHKWLTEQQFLDAVAIAMITPGPVVITVAFIGYLVYGFPGACVAAGATFLPCYLCTVLPAPYFKKFGKNPVIKTLMDGLTTAAIGALAGAVIIIAQRQFVDWVTIVIALIVAGILLLTKAKEPVIILGCALVGYLIKIDGYKTIWA